MSENKEKRINKNFKFKNELIFVGIIFLIAAIFFGINFCENRKNGKFVEITVNGEVYQRIPLNEDKTIQVETEEDNFNEVTIEDGKVYMSDSSCKDHLCENMGHVSIVGVPITCLPNKVVVTIKGEDDKQIDSVVR